MPVPGTENNTRGVQKQEIYFLSISFLKKKVNKNRKNMGFPF